MTSSTLRVFIAVPLSAGTAASLEAAQELLKAGGIAARWTRPAQFHITLKFLGEIPREALPGVAEATGAAIQGLGPFTLSFEGIGAFPGWHRPRVLWAGVAAGREELSVLAARIEEALARRGFPGEARPFTPHVTLGRIPQWNELSAGPAGPPGAAAFAAGPERVGRVVIYESRLTPAGPVYTERYSLPLPEVEPGE